MQALLKGQALADTVLSGLEEGIGELHEAEEQWTPALKVLAEIVGQAEESSQIFQEETVRKLLAVQQGLKQGARQSKLASKHMRSAALGLKAVGAFGKLLRVEFSENVQRKLEELLMQNMSSSRVSSPEEVLGLDQIVREGGG